MADQTLKEVGIANRPRMRSEEGSREVAMGIGACCPEQAQWTEALKQLPQDVNTGNKMEHVVQKVTWESLEAHGSDGHSTVTLNRHL